MIRFPFTSPHPDTVYRAARWFACLNGAAIVANLLLHNLLAAIIAAVGMGASLYLVHRNSPYTRAKADWKTARTLAEVGGLTADWLNGLIPQHPLYGGSPDPETFEIREVLIRLNRAGILTTQSQPWFDGTGAGGSHWRQLAAVTAYVDEETMAVLRDLANVHMLKFMAAPAFDPDSESVVVTTRDGKPYTGFGSQTRDDAGLWADMCSPEVVEALRGAHQVTLIDPDWGGHATGAGPDRLWRVLDEAVDELGKRRV